MPERPLETFYGNVGSSNRNGIEALVNWTPVRNLTFQLAYTWSDFKYTSPDSIKGLSLPNSPVHQLYGDLSYKFANHFEVGVSSEFQSKWYIYTDKVHSDISQDGFSLFHARIAFNFMIKGVKASTTLYVKNLSDKQYIAFTEPDPGGNSYQPGQPLEIYLNARIEVFVSLRLLF